MLVEGLTINPNPLWLEVGYTRGLLEELSLSVVALCCYKRDIRVDRLLQLVVRDVESIKKYEINCREADTKLRSKLFSFLIRTS